MFPNKKVTVTFTTRTIIRVVIIAVLSIVGLALLSKIAHTLTLIFASFFLAIALNPAVSWIASRLRSKSRVRATGMAYLIVLAIIAGFLALVVPTLVRQTTDFIDTLPTSVESSQDSENSVVSFVERYQLEDEIEDTAMQFKDRFGNIGDSVLDTASRLWGILLSVIAVLVLTFMMLVEGPYWIERLWRVQDPKKVPKNKRMLKKMYGVITGYVNGQLLIALISGLFALIALLINSTLLDESVNAVVYALIITITSLIPMFGATIGAIIVVILCAFTSVPLAITMGIFFLIYQQVENATIQPYIQAKQNELTPMLVFIAALIGIGFGGILGAFVAIPLAGCLRVFLMENYGDKLGQSTDKSVKA